VQRIRLVALSALTVLAVDQLGKLVVSRWFPNLVTYNRGAAFSLPIPTWAIVAVFIVLALLVSTAWRDVQRGGVRANVAVGLIVGGATSNLLDRAVRGAVLDFINVRVWPVFNLADSAVVVGTLLLLWYAWGPGRSVGTSKGLPHADTSHEPTVDADRRSGQRHDRR